MKTTLWATKYILSHLIIIFHFAVYLDTIILSIWLSLRIDNSNPYIRSTTVLLYV